MRDEIKIRHAVKAERQLLAVEVLVQLAVFLRLLDEGVDEFKIALALVGVGKLFRQLARRGEHGGERDAHQFAVPAEISEQSDENIFRLSAKIAAARHRLLQHAIPLVMRLVHQRLKQPRLVGKMVIQRRFGNLGVVHDMLHRSRRIAGVGEAFERRLKNLPPGFGTVFQHNLPNGRYGGGVCQTKVKGRTEWFSVVCRPVLDAAWNAGGCR